MNFLETETDYVCFANEQMEFEADTVSEMVKVADGYEQYLLSKPQAKSLGTVYGAIHKKSDWVGNLRWKLTEALTHSDIYLGSASISSEHLFLCKRQSVE